MLPQQLGPRGQRIKKTNNQLKEPVAYSERLVWHEACPFSVYVEGSRVTLTLNDLPLGETPMG